MDSHTPGTHPTPLRPGANPRKAATAAWVGSALEYYDFFIYGTAAALVFGRVFFPGSNPATGTLLALATFGVGYLARPLGALVLGHIGDRYGRKKVMVATVLLMGVATLGVGVLPRTNPSASPRPSSWCCFGCARDSPRAVSRPERTR